MTTKFNVEHLDKLLKTLPNRGDEGKVKRGYVGWGPYEDYLCHEDGGWSSRRVVLSWKEYTKDEDIDLNLIADYYFGVDCDNRPCEVCGQTGYNPETEKLHSSFYRGWRFELTQDEVDALVKEGRLRELTKEFVDGKGWVDKNPLQKITPEMVHAWDRSTPLGHDSINHYILTQARATRLGVYGLCPTCEGKGWERLSDDFLSLNIWMLHPRKGASRAIHIKNVQESDLPSIKKYLAKSFEAHKRHFAWSVGK